MESILQGILFLLMIVGLFVLFNRLMGYRKNYITLDLEERYFDHSSFVEAVQKELESQGRDVTYEGNSRFIIDGKSFLFFERNVSMGGVPLQRAILKPEHKSDKN